MAKPFTGIDIGSYSIKLTACNGGIATKTVIAPLPEGLMADGQIVSLDAMADFIKPLVKDNKLPKDAALILRSVDSLTRRLHMPVMTEKELLLNLPYEFRDYIAQGKDHYFYDYAMLDTVTDEAGEPQELDILACAAEKRTISELEMMCRRAGLRLRFVLPAIAAYQDLIERAYVNGSCCILDFAHRSTKLTFFKDGKFDVARTIEVGGYDVDRAIADTFDVDEHIARGYKHSNFQDCTRSTAANEVYERIAVEIGRALNYYNFNSPDSELSLAYCCGAGTLLEPLQEVVKENVNIELVPASMLLADSAGDPSELAISLQAISATVKAKVK